MTDYIERESLIRLIESVSCDFCDNKVGDDEYADYAKCSDCHYGAEIEDIADFPAADVRPVVHGMWENGHCTSCGEDVASCFDVWMNIQRLLYCPYCGSKIEEAEYFWEEDEG